MLTNWGHSWCHRQYLLNYIQNRCTGHDVCADYITHSSFVIPTRTIHQPMFGKLLRNERLYVYMLLCWNSVALQVIMYLLWWYRLVLFYIIWTSGFGGQLWRGLQLWLLNFCLGQSSGWPRMCELDVPRFLPIISWPVSKSVAKLGAGKCICSQHPLTLILVGHGIKARTHTHWEIT